MMTILSVYRFWIYLIIVNLIGGIVFAFDKSAAKKHKRRIPEKTLHLFEVLGGVFINLLLMYALRHKNRKISYFGWTWLLLLGWLLIIYFIVI